MRLLQSQCSQLLRRKLATRDSPRAKDNRASPTTGSGKFQRAEQAPAAAALSGSVVPVQRVMPDHGERILILQPFWLRKILQGEKVMEIRGFRLTCRTRHRPFFLGCQGKIYGRAQLGFPQFFESIDTFKARANEHLVQTGHLPYKKTYGYALQDVVSLPIPIPYLQKRGSIGIVRYAPASVSP